MPLGKWTYRSWIFLLASVVLVRVLSLNPSWIEARYSSGIYPPVARFFRTITSRIPFSLGDLLYLAAGIWLLRELARWIFAVLQRQVNKPMLANKALNYIRIILIIYLLFNVLWGLNYNRMGVSRQLGLELEESPTSELATLSTALMQKTNSLRPRNPDLDFGAARTLANAAYNRAGSKYPFLQVKPYSLKPSVFGILGNYLGYSGYYNPMTGEGQVNTEVPGFLIPFVACHEMAHQAGYAKENEANFVGFLAARESGDSALLYSTYLNMFLYANRELFRQDSTTAKQNMENLAPGVKKDLDKYRRWASSYDTVIGDMVDVFYNQYLKLNQQPAGQKTYSQVVTWLLAYRRKFGVI